MNWTVALAAPNAWHVLNYRSGLIQSLQTEGYQVAVLSPPGPEVGRIRELGVEHYPVALSPRGLNPFADLGTLADYLGVLRRVRPMALLAFTAKPNIYGSIAARWCGIPTINNVSGLGLVFTRRDWLMRLVSGLYRVALRTSTKVFFQNRDDQALFEHMALVPKGRSRLLPGSGIDTARFAPATTPAPEPFVFLLAARLLWQKGIAEFVEAARRIRASRPDVRFRILGIIEPASSAAVSLEQLRHWEAEGIVDYLGAVDDVRPAFAEAHCIVLPSYYREGVPRVLLEASAMAIPVITTDMPGCREAVDDGETGLICEPRSLESLTNAMMRMLALDGEGRKAMGAAGRAKMEREFEETLVHRAYLDVLGKLDAPRS